MEMRAHRARPWCACLPAQQPRSVSPEAALGPQQVAASTLTLQGVVTPGRGRLSAGDEGTPGRGAGTKPAVLLDSKRPCGLAEMHSPGGPAASLAPGRSEGSSCKTDAIQKAN